MTDFLDQLVSDQLLRDVLESALKDIYISGFVAGEESALASIDDEVGAAYRQGVHDGHEEVLDEIGERTIKEATEAYADGFRNGLRSAHEDDLK